MRVQSDREEERTRTREEKWRDAGTLEVVTSAQSAVLGIQGWVFLIAGVGWGGADRYRERQTNHQEHVRVPEKGFGVSPSISLYLSICSLCSLLAAFYAL